MSIKPVKFVGLHSHSGFSTFDGMDLPQKHIDFVRSNGMNAWALTDHGNMNGYCHAYLHMQKINAEDPENQFKFIPGCEMYVHPDLDVWKLDYEIQRAIKAGDEEKRLRLVDQRSAIAGPVFEIKREHKQEHEVNDEDASLTIENEDETKSSKFYNPIKRRHHMVVLPKTSIGLKRLFGLVSKGYLEGFYRFPRVDYKMIKEAGLGGHIMVTSACIGGPLAYEIFKHFQGVEFEDLKPELLDDKVVLERVLHSVDLGYTAIVNAVGRENFYLELQFNKLNAQHLVNRALLAFAEWKDLQDQLIVTTDSHYSQPELWRERELYKKLGWLNYKDFDPDKLPKSKDELKCELFPKNAQQIWDTYSDTKQGRPFYNDQIVCDAIERTYDIAHNVIQDIRPDTTMKLPSYVCPEGKTDDQALLELCVKGLHKKGLLKSEEYVDRLKYELKVIADKEFSRYFLTMYAVVEVARRRMTVGAGRGSAAGSLVAFVLCLTNIDPLKYDLMFERFLNPSRKGAPDIDTDVADRDLLITMLKEEFGSLNVIPISNFNTFKLKSLVKDVSRFYGIDYSDVNNALKTVENDVKRKIMNRGQDKNLFVLKYSDAIKHSPTFKKFIDKHPDVGQSIEGLFQQNKALGRHAGGVIVAENIPEQMPIIMARGEPQTPWVEGMQYKHLEDFGWIKLDLLGLETLRLIERTAELILKRHHEIENPTFPQIRNWIEENLDPSILDLDDQKVYKYVYEDGHFAGIFQLTSGGAQKLFKKAKPKSIIDIATLTSIYRPGPLNAKVDKLYIEAKNNPDDIDYGHPLIKDVLEETCGLIVFQESIMKLCSIVAGFPEKETDSIRRNIMKRTGAKQVETLAAAVAAKKDFVIGAVKNGVDKQLANDLYEKILYFSGYGFNKSHAVSYAVDSYQCAWLHTYYEEEWLCAYLEAMSSNDKKRAKAFADVKKMGYTIIPLDVNYAEKTWTILPGKRFMPSFLSCKGIGVAAIDEIIKIRKENGGPFNTIQDMLWNPAGEWRFSKFNKRAIEGLISIKAFTSMDVVGKDKTFMSYKHMHNVLIENNTQIKRRLKSKPKIGQQNFQELCQAKMFLDEDDSTSQREWDEWTPQEIAERSVKCLGSFSAQQLLSKDEIDFLEKSGYTPLDEVKKKSKYWFIVCDTVPKLTKNGKPYLIITATGLSGARHRMFCWGWNGRQKIDPYSLCISNVGPSDFGLQTSMRDFENLSEG